MSPRTVAQKMGVRPGSRAYVLGAPESALHALDLPDLQRPDRLGGADKVSRKGATPVLPGDQRE